MYWMSCVTLFYIKAQIPRLLREAVATIPVGT